MEKIKFKNSRGLNLAGVFYSASSQNIIIFCHGFTGDKSEWGRFDKAAERLKKDGYSVLLFDFSGSGESDDDSLTVAKQVEDLKAAIKYVQDRGFINIGIVGLSLGGLVAALGYNKNIKSIVLWAPVTDSRDNYIERFTPEQQKELKEKGFITYTRDKGVRHKIIIDKQMIIDRENIDQKSLLSKIEVPVLIIHGDQDQAVPLTWSRKAMEYLHPESELKIIKGDGHEFSKGLDEVINLTVKWFKNHL